MSWTSEAPKTSGFYWLSTKAPPRVVEVFFHPEQILVDIGEDGEDFTPIYDDYFTDAKWWGPLEPPGD